MRLLRARRLRAGALALALPIAAIAPASASAKAVPNPEFAAYSACPAKVKGVKLCVVATTTSGSFKLGNKTVPIDKPITLQGGLMENSDQLVEPTDGNTLSKTTLTVPGGLVGIEGLGGEVTATTELAEPASEISVNQGALLQGKGTAVLLPIKVKLDNPLLGGECYIGSESQPIVLQLTTGTTSPPAPNHPISGAPGTASVSGGGQIVTLTGTTLVDNSFGAPQATGCGGGLSFLVNPLVNLQVGLPAASGQNTAILSGTVSEASAKAVKKAHVLPKPPKK